MNHPKTPPIAPGVELRPGYWAAQTEDGEIIACCSSLEDLDEAITRRGYSFDSVLLQQVPLDDQEDLLGGAAVEIG
jgi:hypothetical protein